MIGRVTGTTHLLQTPDLVQAERWYTALLGRGPDLEPVDGVVEWELHADTWLQVAQGQPAAGTGQMLRLGVDDIDTAADALRALGIESVDVERIAGVIAFCEFHDPFGNQLSLYQEL